jgi:hypothetical protein
MSQPTDPIAFSRFTEGIAAYGEPDYTAGIPMTAESAYAPPPSPQPAPFIGTKDPAAGIRTPADAPSGNSNTETFASGSSVPEDISTPDKGSPSGYVLESEWEESPYGRVVDLGGNLSYPHDSPEPPAAPPAVVVETEPPVIPETRTEKYDYTLVPAEERPPEGFAADLIDPSYIIPGIGSAPVREAVEEDYDTMLAEEAPMPDALPDHTPPDGYAPLPVPVISGLEQGKYYVQIAAFNRPELIESAVTRIGAHYPLAVQNPDTGEPVYRVLLGPLNLGESGAMLQRVKSIGYKDAFVRSLR